MSLGTFKVTGGKLIVTDPCYDLGTWCQAILKNVRNGEWVADANIHDFGKGGLGGKRVTRLHAKHALRGTSLPWVIEDIDIGVDSGQCGVFSLNSYPEAEAHDSKFYETCCNLTLSPSKAGIVEGTGVVSSSGWGDGGYVLRTRRDTEKKLVELEVIFIDEDEEDLVECSNCDEKVGEVDMDGLCAACQPRVELDEETEEV